jgi:uncharacterized repeat protein (TIGR01451 family)
MKTAKNNIILIIFLFLSSTIFSQTYKWAKSVGGAGYDEITSVVTDLSGNIYSTGRFVGTVDFDPGSGIFNLSAGGGAFDLDIFIQKLDPNGNFVWANKIGGGNYDDGKTIIIDNAGDIIITGRTAVGSNNIILQKVNANGTLVWSKTYGNSTQDYGVSVCTDSSNNIYLTGSYQNTLDFNPGAGAFNITAIGVDIFIQKLDPNGNFIWAKSMGSVPDLNHPRNMTIDNQGNIYVVGFFTGTVDFDPGVGISNITSNGSWDAFIQKLDGNGNFIWAKGIGGSGLDQAQSISIDPLGNIYLTGSFNNLVDFDPGVGVSNLNSLGSSNIFVLRLDVNGDFVWVKGMGSFGSDYGYSIKTDESENIYVTGGFQNTVDFDPGIGINNKTSAGNYDLYIQKLDSYGNLLWVETMGSVGSDFSQSICTNDVGDVIAAGYFENTVDFNSGLGVDTLTSIGSRDIFILKLVQDSCSDLTILFDKYKAISCVDSGYVVAHATHGKPPYSYSWNTLPVDTTPYTFFNTTGIYTLTVTDNNGCTASSSILINGPSSQSGFDLNANLIATTFRSGFSAIAWIDAFNSRCDTVSGQLTMVLDSLLTLDSTSITPDYINGDTLTWNFNALNYDSLHLQPNLFFTVDSSAIIGDTICIDVVINPITGDADTSNNIKHYCFPVINGYDPNDKQVYPQGECTEKYVLNNERLTYSLRFQNTGNAGAINIYLIDSISPFLDINTVRVIGQSHDSLYTEILDNNVLKFHFDSIQLPDSSSNQAASHGFVIFEINPYPSLPNGTIINNKSEIYFDFNPPIVTNTATNTLVPVLPLCSTVRIEKLVSKEDEINIYPNPTSNQFTIDTELEISEITIIDITGKNIRTIKQNTKTINVADLSNGIYFIQLITEERTITKKFVKQ